MEESKGWISHVRGTALLLHLRGQQQFNTLRGRTIFRLAHGLTVSAVDNPAQHYWKAEILDSRYML